MTSRSDRSVQATAVGAVLTIAMVGLVMASCGNSNGGGASGSTERSPTTERRSLTGESGAVPATRLDNPHGVRLGRSAEAALVVAAQRFATTLADWLYGNRRAADVEPVTPEVRRKIGRELYVPSDQIGTGEGRAVDLRVSVQTLRSGVLVVTVRDSRTSYRVSATFERRAGRWQIVRLNTD